MVVKKWVVVASIIAGVGIATAAVIYTF